MAGIAFAEFLPVSFTAVCRSHRDAPADDDLEILHDASPFGSPFLDPLRVSDDLFFVPDLAPSPRSGYEELGIEAGVGPASESDGYGDADLDVDIDVDLPLNWDSLRIDETRRALAEEFEWEEVIGSTFDREAAAEIGAGSEEEEEIGRSIEWEVLLSGIDGASYAGDESDGYVFEEPEHDFVFGQFADHGGFSKGPPPAAHAVIESLPLVLLGNSDDTVCAVCRDEIASQEAVKRLPCLHHFHGDCILPWLLVRNTCPVCRYELPTDNAEYEEWNLQRSSTFRRRRAAAVLETIPEEW